MKKFLIIGLIVSLVLIVVGGAGLVSAKVQEASNPATVTVTNTQNGDQTTRKFGPGGMMGGNGGMMGGNGSGGMMGGNGGMMGGYGPGGMMNGRGMMSNMGRGVMRNYMISAFASAVGLTVDEVTTRLANGETPQQIALAQGKTQTDLPTLWTQVSKAAMDQAVKDGVITQAQADAMLQNMDKNAAQGLGFGFGNCPMNDGDETTQP